MRDMSSFAFPFLDGAYSHGWRRHRSADGSPAASPSPFDIARRRHPTGVCRAPSPVYAMYPPSDARKPSSSMQPAQSGTDSGQQGSGDDAIELPSSFRRDEPKRSPVAPSRRLRRADRRHGGEDLPGERHRACRAERAIGGQFMIGMKPVPVHPATLPPRSPPRTVPFSGRHSCGPATMTARSRSDASTCRDPARETAIARSSAACRPSRRGKSSSRVNGGLPGRRR